MPYLTEEQLRRALTLADLTDPAYGPHCMQQLVAGATGALRERWGCPVARPPRQPRGRRGRQLRRAGLPARRRRRATSRYTRYVDAGACCAARPRRRSRRPCASWRRAPPDDVLVCAPGLVYRRDAIDRLHVGEPHQLDLWRVAARPMAPLDLEAMIAAVVEALLPGRAMARAAGRAPVHARRPRGRGAAPAASGSSCSSAASRIPTCSPPAGCGGHSGLAMGIGLDRAVMLRKGIGDIRLLRSDDPRVAGQMRDLERLPRGLGPAARRGAT